jgi:uncharacterized protein (DUF2147 family)
VLLFISCQANAHEIVKKFIIFLTGLLILTGALAGQSVSSDGILGVWKTYDEKGKVDSTVEIYKEKDTYCAKIVSLVEATWPPGDDQGMAGKPKNDRFNPNAELRSRPIVGMQFMQNFVFNPNKNIWENGKIYDPACGKTYKCKLTLTSANKLEVRGYIGISLLGRTEIWSR